MDLALPIVIQAHRKGTPCLVLTRDDVGFTEEGILRQQVLLCTGAVDDIQDAVQRAMFLFPQQA